MDVSTTSEVVESLADKEARKQADKIWNAPWNNIDAELWPIFERKKWISQVLLHAFKRVWATLQWRVIKPVARA